MKFMRMFKDERGFTLIELVFVIIIIAVLAGIALVNLGSSEDDAKAAVAKADLRSLATALKVYKAKTNAFPAVDGDDATTHGLDVLLTDNGDYKAMLDELPVDPYSTTEGETYNYSITDGVVTISCDNSDDNFARDVR